MSVSTNSNKRWNYEVLPLLFLSSWIFVSLSVTCNIRIADKVYGLIKSIDSQTEWIYKIKPMIMISESLKFDTIKLVTSSKNLISFNKSLFRNDVDLSTGEVKSVLLNSQNTGNVIPFELYIHANYQSGRMTIEFSSKILLEDYVKLISVETLPQCLCNIERIGICSLDTERIIEDCYITKLHITKDIDLELTSEILDRLNLCTGDYRRYKWDKYDDGILFRKNVKSANCRESMTIYNKEKEILLSKNKAFLNTVNNTEAIKTYFYGKTRFEVQFNNKRKIMKELSISDTSVKTLMNVDKNVLIDNIACLVPLYHSLGTVRDTFVVPLVALAGTGTKCVI